MFNLDVLKNYNKQSVGQNIFVKPYTGNDGNTGLTPDAAVKTLAKALSIATADQNDIVYLVQESNTASKTTDYQSVPLDWNKDGVHLVGLGVCDSAYIGQRARIANLSTAVSASTLFTLSADNCLISGIEFFHQAGSNDLAAAQICVTVSGSRNVIRNCQISGIGAATVDTLASASLSVTGAENLFKNCYIGLDTVIRAECLSEVRIGGSATRTVFEDCIINSYTSATTFKAVLFTHASAHTLTVFKNTIINSETNRTSCVTVTGAIDPGSIAGHIVVNGGGVYGYADVCTSDSSVILLIGATPGTNVDAMVGKAVDVA
jgi:hypothetical protein